MNVEALSGQLELTDGASQLLDKLFLLLLLLDSNSPAIWENLGSGQESRGIDRMSYSSQESLCSSRRRAARSLHKDSQLCDLTIMIYGCHGEGMKPYILY